MNPYISGELLKTLREKKGLTQAELAACLSVSHKTVSKWETMRGLPDITLLEPLAGALGVSVAELLAGEAVVNRNRAGNSLRSKCYVCPVCGNVIHAMGEAVISCCGIPLPPLEAEEGDDQIVIKPVEDEFLVGLSHPMTKTHFISFLAHVSYDGIQIKKLYPEQECEARFSLRGGGMVYAYCNHHGHFGKKLLPARRKARPDFL